MAGRSPSSSRSARRCTWSRRTSTCRSSACARPSTSPRFATAPADGEVGAPLSAPVEGSAHWSSHSTAAYERVARLFHNGQPARCHLPCLGRPVSPSVAVTRLVWVAAELVEMRRREEEAGITPEPALDRFMEAMSLQARLHFVLLTTGSGHTLGNASAR